MIAWVEAHSVGSLASGHPTIVALPPGGRYAIRSRTQPSVLHRHGRETTQVEAAREVVLFSHRDVGPSTELRLLPQQEALDLILMAGDLEAIRERMLDRILRNTW